MHNDELTKHNVMYLRFLGQTAVCCSLYLVCECNFKDVVLTMVLQIGLIRNDRSLKAR